MDQERTIILYHANCPDGFGAAYSAWKKFGETAEYRAMNYGKPAPDDLAGAHVYFVDFCYAQEEMDQVKAVAKTLTVLDHHEGTEDIVRSMPEHVYDVDRSGASITWSYFHPDTEVPELIRFVEDDDLFRFALPDTKAVMAYLSVQPFTFELWDELATTLQDPATAATLLDKARNYREYFDLLISLAVERAKLVEFEGHTIYIGQTHPMKTMISALGHELAKKQGPFALIVQIGKEGLRVSMRGDGSIDLTKIAQKYGGNGHISSAAFLAPWGVPFPWTYLD